MENNFTQHEKGIKNIYEFTYTTYVQQIIFGALMILAITASLMPIYSLAEHYQIEMILIAIPVPILVYAIFMKFSHIVKRNGVGILHENYLELHLHETKHIIEYQEIDSIETFGNSIERGISFRFGIKGKRNISIKPASSKELSISSDKAIVIFQEALAKKIEDKGLTVKRIGMAINKAILEKE